MTAADKRKAVRDAYLGGRGNRRPPSQFLRAIVGSLDVYNQEHPGLLQDLMELYPYPGYEASQEESSRVASIGADVLFSLGRYFPKQDAWFGAFDDDSQVELLTASLEFAARFNRWRLFVATRGKTAAKTEMDRWYQHGAAAQPAH